MSGRDRRDRDRRPGERRDSQPDDEQPQRTGEVDLQEGDSLTALKAILAKVAALLVPLQLNQDESISLVEQLYGSVLDTDVRLAGETDDRRKASMLAHIQNTNVTRSGGKIVVEYPSADKLKADAAPKAAPVAAPVVAEPVVAPYEAPEPAVSETLDAAEPSVDA
jgi:hypothetical protein